MVRRQAELLNQELKEHESNNKILEKNIKRLKKLKEEEEGKVSQFEKDNEALHQEILLL